MSARDDNFLARWSRRKQAVKESEAVALPQEAAQEEPAAAGPQESADSMAAEAEPLPRVEDLTADSDVSAFLRKGVPEALKKAALRRMWSLDPTIRDFVGPADYAWDYNNPSSIPGFGPATAAAAAKVVAELSRALPEALPRPPAEPIPPPRDSEGAQATPDVGSQTTADHDSDATEGPSSHS
jgi:hypothetical protein